MCRVSSLASRLVSSLFRTKPESAPLYSPGPPCLGLPPLSAPPAPTAARAHANLRRIQLPLPQLKAKFGGRAGENRGATTTMADADAKLLANVQDQMSRLLSQLKDLDELRDEHRALLNME